MQTYQANPSTAQTNTVLSAAQTGRVQRIRSIFISSDTATTVTLMNSATHATEILKLYVGASGGVWLDRLSGFHTLPGEGVDYSTADAGNVFIKASIET